MGDCCGRHGPIDGHRNINYATWIYRVGTSKLISVVVSGVWWCGEWGPLLAAVVVVVVVIVVIVMILLVVVVMVIVVILLVVMVVVVGLVVILVVVVLTYMEVLVE